MTTQAHPEPAPAVAPGPVAPVAPGPGPADTYAGRPPSYETTFASSSVRIHLVRGAIGLPLLVAAFVLIGPVGPVALLLAVPAVVLLRGCPTCWALGLSQTRACELRTRDAPPRHD